MSEHVENVIREKVAAMKSGTNVYALGSVRSLNGHVVTVGGLEGVSFFEEVSIADVAQGYVSAIERDHVVVTMVRASAPLQPGDEVRATGKEFGVRFSEEELGHIVDIFGMDKLAERSFEGVHTIPIENPPMPLMDRSPVVRPLLTGIAGIDLIYPVGRGQRQLIVGSKRSGKTQIALDAILNQKDQDVICIYAAIGKTKKEIKEIYAELGERQALSYTLMLVALNDDFPSILSLTPFASLSIAETYLAQGRDVLVVIDDLKRHAEAYREIGLMSGKAPGRDAYPSDIFYQHARLLEKGCQHVNGGSITILPLVESIGEEVTDYITTNVISITDGQIVLSRKAFEKGQKPAINYGLSVSRLGGAVQNPEVKKLGARVRRELLSYLETREVFELANRDEMGEAMRTRMENGEALLKTLNQYRFAPRMPAEMIDAFSSIVGGDEE